MKCYFLKMFFNVKFFYGLFISHVQWKYFNMHLDEINYVQYKSKMKILFMILSVFTK